ncbi:MAG: hypothetical protein HZC54_20725 [Verrucomicrobia bacterium]|nr:hypothetical protein [Verrucomicrobiota bacterium]
MNADGTRMREDAMKTISRSIVLVALTWTALGCNGGRLDGHQVKQSGTAVACVTNKLEYASVYIEPEISNLLAKHQIDETNLASQLSPWIVKEQLDLTGKWDKPAMFDNISLTLKKRNDERYDVDCDAGGCCAAWTLKRTGSFDGGVLILDRPVRQYVPRPPFRFFYLLRTPLGIRLVDQHVVREWILKENVMKWPPNKWDGMMRDYWNSESFLDKVDPTRVVKSRKEASQKGEHVPSIAELTSAAEVKWKAIWNTELVNEWQTIFVIQPEATLAQKMISLNKVVAKSTGGQTIPIYLSADVAGMRFTDPTSPNRLPDRSALPSLGKVPLHDAMIYITAWIGLSCKLTEEGIVIGLQEGIR